ncbi:hypothetical protein [Shigella dysenteriae]
MCNCTQAIMTHIITSFLAFIFFNAASLTVIYSSLTDSKT